MSTLLEVKDIHCHYGKFAAVKGTSFNLQVGELVCLLGPSGCGKTTVLRAIAGFQRLTQGEIHLGGICLSNPKGSVPPEKRQMGMVFQDHALFPHLTVTRNVEAGLRHLNAAKKKAVVDQILAQVGLINMDQRYPHELSSGQQQRVALARALAPCPRLLLMDEPFSNLDVELRDKLGHEVHELLIATETTCILVTHDQQDAFTFGGKVGIMNRGQIEQWDTPYNLYHQPVNRFVADFIGEGTLLDGEILTPYQIKTELTILAGNVPPHCHRGDKVKVLVRPDDIIHDDHSTQSARIVKRAFRGESYLYTLQLPSGSLIQSTVPSHHNHAIGEKLGIRIDINHLIVFSD